VCMVSVWLHILTCSVCVCTAPGGEVVPLHRMQHAHTHTHYRLEYAAKH
jgi:hypothetical protein